MEGIFSGNPFEFEDQYIPSGNWYSPHHDESNAGSFFPENYSPDCFEDSQWSNPSHQENEHPESRTLSRFPEQSSMDVPQNTPQKNDPFSVRCRIPVPDLVPVSGYQLWLETSFMCRRNERERQRVRNVNDGFSRLRNHLPRNAHVRRRQSKVDTLRHAIDYIKQLQTILDDKNVTEGVMKTSSASHKLLSTLSS